MGKPELGFPIREFEGMFWQCGRRRTELLAGAVHSVVDGQLQSFGERHEPDVAGAEVGGREGGGRFATVGGDRHRLGEEDAASIGKFEEDGHVPVFFGELEAEGVPACPIDLMAIDPQRVAILVNVDREVAEERFVGRRIQGAETNIHYPTDSSLLADGVRVLGRSLTRAKAVVGQAAVLAKVVFRNRTHSAKRAAREVGRLSRHGREKTLPAYKRLVQTAQATVRQVEKVLAALDVLELCPI